MKRIISLILSVLMIAAVLPFSAFAGRFEDIADGKWYTEGISFCAANDYMSGVADGVFDRSSNLTRAMFMTVLAQVDGVDLSAYNGRTLFNDVAVGKWYAPAITWAAENGLAGGIGDGLFGYKNNITREQMALILYGYTANKGLDTSAIANVYKFDDASKIHSWAFDAVVWAVGSGLISGTSETILDPRGTCTRAQAAVIIRAYVLGFISTCEHDWEAPTCTESGYCTKCSLKSGTELGHDKGVVDCSVTASCIRCGVTVNGVDHKANAATCTAPSVCSVCNLQVAPAKGHNYSAATCTAPSKCINCGHQKSAALGHTTGNGVCTRCNKEIFASAHNKLVYYLNTQGQSFDKFKGFVYQSDDVNINRTYYVAVIPGDSTVYMGAYSEEDGLIFEYELELSSISWAYNFTNIGYANDNDFYETTGGVVASSGAHNIQYFNATSDSYRSLSETNAEIFFGDVIWFCDYLTKTYANGLSLSEYGFGSEFLYTYS